MDASSLSLSELTKMEDYDPNSIQVEQARQLIRQFLNPLSEIETIPLQQAYQRTLAADIQSPMNVPPHDYSAMDGYAARHADLQQAPRQLKLVGSAFAGRPFTGQVGEGECV